MQLPNGGRRDIFMTHAVAIAKFIKTNKIEPVQKEVLLSRNVAPVAVSAMGDIAESTTMRPWWIYGGMKVPHLHYKGEIYILNEKQWGDFSTMVLQEFRAKLADVKTVGFNQLMDLSDVVNDIR
ncbi:MAG: hypothetical protein GKC10_07355 [Methanosarcinales archaeon]|nr:hypothetical protein [Methanosarcinales archaeon]